MPSSISEGLSILARPAAITTFGWVASVGPNAAHHFGQDGWSAFSDSSFYADLITDTAGWGFSSYVAGPTTAVAIGGASGILLGPEAAPFGVLGGYFAGSIGGSIYWDSQLAPTVKQNVVSPALGWIASWFSDTEN